MTLSYFTLFHKQQGTVPCITRQEVSEVTISIVDGLDWHLEVYFLISSFYRVTLCLSAVFAVARCPSVRPSVTLVDCIQTAEDIVKFLCHPGSPSILVFESKPRYPIPRGIPSVGGAKYTGVGKYCDFRLKSPSTSKTVRDRLMVGMEH